MASFERQKDVSIGENKYQVQKFSAKIAMYIASQVFTKIVPMGIDGGLSISSLPKDRELMTEKEFGDLIDYCMCACKQYKQIGDNEMLLPVMVVKGKWAIAELEYDLTTVAALCVHVLSFNITSFFKSGALKTIAESLSDLKDLPLFNIQQ